MIISIIYDIFLPRDILHLKQTELDCLEEITFDTRQHKICILNRIYENVLYTMTKLRADY